MIELVRNIKKSVLTVIRPVRIDDSNDFLIKRLSNHRLDKLCPDSVSFVIVDEGSSTEYSQIICRECLKLDIGYIRLKKMTEHFSIGRARNAGVQLAQSDFVFFQDLDLLPYDGFYSDLIDQIDISKIREDHNQFCMVPCVYLTEEKAKAFDGSKKMKNWLLREAVLGNKTIADRISTGTSCCLYSKEKYLQMGGNNPKFEGWGFEDLDFNCRLLRKSKLFPLAENWSLEKDNFNTVLEYKGWKATYRMFGDLTLHQGIVLFHAWHPIHKSRKEGGALVKNNQQLFLNNLKAVEDGEPLADLTKGRTLVLKKCAFTINDAILPYWGEVVYKAPDDFRTQDDFLGFISLNKISRVVFANPYASEKVRDLFDAVKKVGVKFVICERGALPNSYFYDSNGFLFDSGSYSNDKWLNISNDENGIFIKNYARELFFGNAALEAQMPPIGITELREKYKIGYKKIIFIPLQRPNDTAVKFFKRDKSYQQFLDLLPIIADKIPTDYVLLIKKHPLEDNIPKIRRGVLVDENINSLVQSADTILTYTSGVGLLGLLAEKRVLTVGNSFYTQPGLAFPVNDLEDILSSLNAPYDVRKYHKFLDYLIRHFYSFGKQIVRPVKMPNGERMTATTKIIAEVTRVEGYEIRSTVPSRVYAGWDSILFDRYRKRNVLPSEIKAPQVVEKMPLNKEKSPKELKEARLQKLKKDPKRYCADSKHSFLRVLSKFIK